MNIARASIQTPVNVWLMALVLLIGGIIALGEIGRLEDPAFTIKQVKVITQFPGANAKRVEQEITEPLEIAIQQMAQLDRVSSISSPGKSDITVEVKPNFDSEELPQIWDELRKRLRDATSSLPQGAHSPIVYDDFGDVFGLYYALTAPDFSANEMREFARIIRRDLLTTEGVAKVEVNGLVKEQIVVYLDPFQIAGLGVSFPEFTQLLQENIKPFSGGRVQIDGKKVRILMDDPIDTINELYELSFVLPGTNRAIKVKDVATLKLEPADIQPSLVRYQGEQAITLAVSALNGVNIVDVGKQVNQKINTILSKLPIGITLTPIYDQAQIVESSVDGFITNLVLSVSVVTLTLCLFMGWRSGVVVGSVLLITVLGTVLIMWLMDIQLQRISLGAMVIAMGMLVDNAIVVAEGMTQRMQKGKSAIKAASFVVKRTQWPLLGATVIGIAAFSGIGLSDDATGEFLYSLFIVVLISLLLSWVLAVSLVPLLGSYLYPCEKKKDSDQKQTQSQLLFLSFLQTALNNPLKTVGLLITVTALAFGSFKYVKQGFFPASNTPIFFLHYWGSQTNDIRFTEEKIKQAENIILKHEEVEFVTSFVGRGADRFTLTYGPEAANESYGLLLVRATHKDAIDDLSKILLNELKAIDLNGDIYLERMQFGPGGGAKLSARFSGPDSTVLRQLAEEAKTIFLNDEQIRDVRHNWREKGLAIATHYDEFNAGMAGVSRNDFSNNIQYATSGLELGKVWRDDHAYPVLAKLSTSDQTALEAIETSQVWSSHQRLYVPFTQVSEKLELVNEEVLLQRRNRIRTITVMAEPGFNETAGEAFDRIRPQIKAIALPEGYKLEWGGEYESSKDAQKALGKGLPAGFLVMLLISILLFGKVRQPLIIWLVVPMASVGVVAGLLLTNMPFGFMSLLGFLSLFGMLIKNAIVLIEEIDLQSAEGIETREAIISASLSRLRPVSLAAITTILGMAPLLFDPFFADMAVTIMAGLAFATVLTLIAVPVLYSLFFKAQIKH